MADLFQPARLGPVTLRNRFLKAATFEGMAVDGLVTERLIDFHRAIAAGGVGMTTLAYLAVSPDAQGAPSEIVVRPEAVPGLACLVAAVHDEGALASAQIGHAGPVSAALGKAGLGPSRVFSPMTMRFTRAANEQDLDGVVRDFANAACLLRDAGFDAIEVHLGHNYLLSAFLSPALNRRSDKWGGSIANRAELARRVVLAVRQTVGPGVAVLGKLNMVDGYTNGLQLPDGVEAARLLEADGALDALELTGGSSLKNPMYLLRGHAPVGELAANFPQPIRTAIRLFGKRFLRDYPFEEGYFLAQAREFRSAVSLPLVALGGINRLETVHRAMRDGFEFVALGRALLREPDLVRRWQSGNAAAGSCTHCNQCVPSIYTGTACVLVAPADRPGHRAATP